MGSARGQVLPVGLMERAIHKSIQIPFTIVFDPHYLIDFIKYLWKLSTNRRKEEQHQQPIIRILINTRKWHNHIDIVA